MADQQKTTNVQSVFDRQGEFYMDEGTVRRILMASQSMADQLMASLESNDPLQVKAARKRVKNFHAFAYSLGNLINAAKQMAKPL